MQQSDMLHPGADELRCLMSQEFKKCHDQGALATHSFLMGDYKIAIYAIFYIKISASLMLYSDPIN